MITATIHKVRLFNLTFAFQSIFNSTNNFCKLDTLHTLYHKSFHRCCKPKYVIDWNSVKSSYENCVAVRLDTESIILFVCTEFFFTFCKFLYFLSILQNVLIIKKLSKKRWSLYGWFMAGTLFECVIDRRQLEKYMKIYK